MEAHDLLENLKENWKAVVSAYHDRMETKYMYLCMCGM